MKRGSWWSGMIGGCALMVCGACTVQQQQQVLGTIGQAIPGARDSMFGNSGSSSESASGSQAASPAPRVDPNRVEAQLVLYTMQRAMSENPSPFQECLDKSECRSALSAHLIRLQKQAMSTLELPPAYDRYDLKRGQE